MMDTTYNVGIYCRLSNDDERDGESVSIENQESICQGGIHPKGEIPSDKQEVMKLYLRFYSYKR